MEFLSALLFALAVSADGFIVGLAYGLKKIKIPWLSALIIVLISTIVVSLAMICGRGLAAIMSERWATSIGAIILMAIGVYYFLGACREKIYNINTDIEKPLMVFNVAVLGIVVQILKNPATADMDTSGEISYSEAVFLGLALSLDAFGAGLGLAMTSFNILFTALCVGVLNFILINSGVYLGGVVTNNNNIKMASSLVSALIFIAIAIFKII